MNEFTKEELEYIRDYIFRGAASIRHDKLIELDSKLQSLIDDYCQHESEMDRKNKIYREHILPRFDNDPDKVPPYLEPYFNEGWK